MTIRNLVLGSITLIISACSSNSTDDLSEVYAEVVRFTLNDGVADASLLATENAIREGQIQDQPGYLGRELYRDDTGAWLVIIRWDSKEASEAWSPVFNMLEEGQTFGSLLDFSSARQEHYTEALPPAEGGASRDVGTHVEVVRFTLNDGVTDDAVLAAENAIREGQIQDQPGYLGRDLYRDDTGAWLAVIYWDSKEASEAWSPVFNMLEEGQTFGSLLDFSRARQEHYTQSLP